MQIYISKTKLVIFFLILSLFFSYSLFSGDGGMGFSPDTPSAVLYTFYTDCVKDSDKLRVEVFSKNLEIERLKKEVEFLKQMNGLQINQFEECMKQLNPCDYYDCD